MLAWGHSSAGVGTQQCWRGDTAVLAWGHSSAGVGTQQCWRGDTAVLAWGHSSAGVGTQPVMLSTTIPAQGSHHGGVECPCVTG